MSNHLRVEIPSSALPQEYSHLGGSYTLDRVTGGHYRGPVARDPSFEFLDLKEVGEKLVFWFGGVKSFITSRPWRGCLADA